MVKPFVFIGGQRMVQEIERKDWFGQDIWFNLRKLSGIDFGHVGNDPFHKPSLFAYLHFYYKMPAVCIGTPNVYDGIFTILLLWCEFRAEVFKRSDRVAERKQVVQQAHEQVRPFCKYFLKSQV